MNTLNKPKGESVNEGLKSRFAVPKLLKNIAGMVGISVLSALAPHNANAEPVIPGESINMPSPNAFRPHLVDIGNGSLRMVYRDSSYAFPDPQPGDPLLKIDTKRVDLETKCDPANGDFVITQHGMPALAPYAVPNLRRASGFGSQTFAPLEYIRKDPSGKEADQVTIIRQASNNEFSTTGSLLVRQLPNGALEYPLNGDDCVNVG